MPEKKKSAKLNDTLSIILEQGIVKMYHALDITRYTASYFEKDKTPECWIYKKYTVFYIEWENIIALKKFTMILK